MINNWSQFTIDNINYFIENKYHLSKDSFLLRYIKNEYKNIKLYIYNNNINIIVQKIDNYDINNLKKLCNSQWVDNNLIKEIDRLKNIYEIKWSNNKIILNVDTINKILLLKIKKIIYIIEYIKSKSNIKKKIIIYLILSNLKKKFPKTEIINIQHVNSGYTDHGDNIIFVWRYEEFEKVIFHEIIHYLKLDKYYLLNYKLFKIKGPHSYFEVITDFYAIIYNLIYISLLTKLNIKSLLEIELAFIENQALYLNNYFKLGKWNNIPDIIINQNTPAFSYYILKFIMFKYSLENDFINLIDYSEIFKLGINNNINKFINIKSARMTLFSLI